MEINRAAIQESLSKKSSVISIKGKAYWQNEIEGQNTEGGCLRSREQIGSRSDASATFQFEHILFMVMR